MESVESIITFTFLRRKVEGKVLMFTPVNRLMIRVYVEMNLKGLPKEQVFIFYKLDNGKLFWYAQDSEIKQEMAETIAKSIQF
jgi:hypothetical protein